MKDPQHSRYIRLQPTKRGASLDDRVNELTKSSVNRASSEITRKAAKALERCPA